MTFARTMYKLLIVALTISAIAIALDMSIQIAGLIAMSRAGMGGGIQTIISIIWIVGRFLSAFVALYWIPRLVRQQFPEVSRNALP